LPSGDCTTRHIALSTKRYVYFWVVGIHLEARLEDHSKAKRALQDIWMAETKKDAIMASDAFAAIRPPIEDGFWL
jgi:hypothetical protein